MKQLGNRLRTLREGLGISQAKFAEIIGSTQSSINRYENGQATPTVELLRKYADYFDVSMDYIFARCDEPQGKLYQAKPPVENNPELAKFVEMCFDPELKTPLTSEPPKVRTSMVFFLFPLIYKGFRASRSNLLFGHS